MVLEMKAAQDVLMLMKKDITDASNIMISREDVNEDHV